ncbi:hypothetical protein K449DRAFT_432668 [Hypoxylon sp. EC38]|nr:hypothetical protein K449DRAFT_432668 [Hypoxylon sp. EC38]
MSTRKNSFIRHRHFNIGPQRTMWTSVVKIRLHRPASLISPGPDTSSDAPISNNGIHSRNSHSSSHGSGTIITTQVAIQLHQSNPFAQAAGITQLEILPLHLKVRLSSFTIPDSNQPGSWETPCSALRCTAEPTIWLCDLGCISASKGLSNISKFGTGEDGQIVNFVYITPVPRSVNGLYVLPLDRCHISVLSVREILIGDSRKQYTVFSNGICKL